LKNLLGTKLNTQVAALATHEDEVNATSRYLKLTQVHGCTCEDLHTALAFGRNRQDIQGTPPNITGD
jgi:hypothetical protein